VPRVLRQQVRPEPIHFARVPLRIGATRHARPWASPSLAVPEPVVVVTLVWRLQLEARPPKAQDHCYYRMPWPTVRSLGFRKSASTRSCSCRERNCDWDDRSGGPRCLDQFLESRPARNVPRSAGDARLGCHRTGQTDVCPAWERESISRGYPWRKCADVLLPLSQRSSPAGIPLVGSGCEQPILSGDELVVFLARTPDSEALVPHYGPFGILRVRDGTVGAANTEVQQCRLASSSLADLRAEIKKRLESPKVK